MLRQRLRNRRDSSGNRGRIGVKSSGEQIKRKLRARRRRARNSLPEISLQSYKGYGIQASSKHIMKFPSKFLDMCLPINAIDLDTLSDFMQRDAKTRERLTGPYNHIHAVSVKGIRATLFNRCMGIESLSFLRNLPGKTTKRDECPGITNINKVCCRIHSIALDQHHFSNKSPEVEGNWALGGEYVAGPMNDWMSINPTNLKPSSHNPIISLIRRK